MLFGTCAQHVGALVLDVVHLDSGLGAGRDDALDVDLAGAEHDVGLVEVRARAGDAVPFAMSLRCVNQKRPGYLRISLTGSAPPDGDPEDVGLEAHLGPDSFTSTSKSVPSGAGPNSWPWMWYAKRLPFARHCVDQLAKSSRRLQDLLAAREGLRLVRKVRVDDRPDPERVGLLHHPGEVLRQLS